MSDPYRAMEAEKTAAALSKTVSALEALHGLLPPAGSAASGPRLSPVPARKRRRLAARASRRANR